MKGIGLKLNNMSIVWKDLKEDTKISEPDNTLSLREELLAGCTTYFGVDTPTCTNRGKYKNEKKVCWDTIKNLRYTGKRLILNNTSYKLFFCKECGDYFIEENDSDLEDEEIFTCFECNKIILSRI